MVNRKAVHDNVDICRDLMDEAEKLLEQAILDASGHGYLTDLLKICLNNITSVSMKLEIASNITDSVD